MNLLKLYCVRVFFSYPIAFFYESLSETLSFRYNDKVGIFPGEVLPLKLFSNFSLGTKLLLIVTFFFLLPFTSIFFTSYIISEKIISDKINQ